MKILIFGATGLVGYALKRECEKRNIEISCPTHKELDISNKKALIKYIKSYNPTIIINSAAIAGNKQSLTDKKKTFDINVRAVRYITDICTEEDILLIHMSSSSIFDGKGKYYEESIPNPNTYYGRTKYLAELYIINNCSKYYIVRLPLIFGDRNNKAIGVLDKFIEDIKSGKDLKIATDKVQSCGYSRDMATAIIDLVGYKRDYGIYHLYNKGYVNLYDFIQEANKYLGEPAKITKGKCEDFGENKSKIILGTSKKRKPIRHWKKAIKEYISTVYRKDW